jgi:hypothetical protein
MLARTFDRLGRLFCIPLRRRPRPRAFPPEGIRPSIECLEDRTLLSAANQALVAQMHSRLRKTRSDVY